MHLAQGGQPVSDGINRKGINDFLNAIQKEFDKRPIRIPVNTEMPELPHIGGNSTVNNYNGPVFHGNVNGAQLAWGNGSVLQDQQNAKQVASGYEQLADFVVQILRQLPDTGLSDEDQQDAQDVAETILTEVTQPEPNAQIIRRAINTLKGVLAPLITGAGAGTSDAIRQWVETVINGLTTSR